MQPVVAAECFVHFYRAMLSIRGTRRGPVSVRHKSEFVETDERIELVFGMGASFDLSDTVL